MNNNINNYNINNNNIIIVHTTGSVFMVVIPYLYSIFIINIIPQCP